MLSPSVRGSPPEDMLRAAPEASTRRDMALAYNHEEITPRELKPALLELDGISRETIEAHYKLYQGYVNKRNEILGQARRRRPLERQPGLLRVPRAEGRSDASRSAGSRTTRSTSSTSAARRRPGRHLRRPRQARLRLGRRLEGRPEGDRASAGRGWAWTAYDWDEGRLFNYIGDAQNTFPVWNATPLVALDVYEHAYFIDFGTDRGCVHRRLLQQPRLTTW